MDRGRTQGRGDTILSVRETSEHSKEIGMTKVQPGQSISEVPEPTTAGDPPIRRSGWILLWSANVVISLSVIALLPTRDTAHLVVAGVFSGIGSVMVAMGSEERRVGDECVSKGRYWWW